MLFSQVKGVAGSTQCWRGPRLSADTLLFIQAASAVTGEAPLLGLCVSHWEGWEISWISSDLPQIHFPICCAVRTSPPQCFAQDPACPESSGCFPDGRPPIFPPLQTPRNGDQKPEPLHPPAAPHRLCPERWQRQHLATALQPSPNAAPLVSPQEKYHLGLRCNRSDVVWKERRICFNQQRVGLQPKYTGGLQARLYPGPPPGDGPNPGLRLGRANSRSAVLGQFTPGFHRGSSGGAQVSPLPSALSLKLAWSGRDSW